MSAAAAPRRLAARLQIDASHPSLAGHFPGHPIVPGVLLLDALLRLLDEAAGGTPPAGWRLQLVKFHHAVLPGESLQLEIDAGPGGAWRLGVRRAGVLVLSGTAHADAPAVSAA